MQPNLHDAFFKAILSPPEQAASLLRDILPPAVAAQIDFATLASCPGSFVDEALKERQSDLLFTASTVGPEPRSALLYLLFEHQSSVDARMPFRILRYEVRIWERWLRDNPEARKMPVILPVVLHHSDTGWTAATSFEELLDADPVTLAAVAPHVPRFELVMEDISHATDEALAARAVTALVRLALFCLRHAREPEVLVERLQGWVDLVRQVRRAPGGAAALLLVMRYIGELYEPERPEELVTRLLAAVGEVGKEEIVTGADMLRQQGREQGEERGQKLGRSEMLLDLLRERFGALPEAVVARVTGADLEQLRTWSRRVLTAATLDDVLAG